MPTPLYQLDEAMMVLVEISTKISQEKLDEYVALYCHGRFGNYDDSADVESQVIRGACRYGLPPVRARTFQLWKRIYRRANDSAYEFIIKVQTEERRIFGSNDLYHILQVRR